MSNYNQEEGDYDIITHYGHSMKEIVPLSSASQNCLNRRYSLMITNIAIALMILGSDMDTFVLKVLTNICCNKVVLLDQISAVSFYQIFLGFFFFERFKRNC